MDRLRNPGLVIAVFHYRCPYRCRFCSQRNYKPLSPCWTFEQITHNLEPLWRDATIANIGGVGEVGILPYFYELLDYFIEHGVGAGFTTNGRYLDVPRVRRALINNIVVSLHTVHEPTYDDLTGTKGNLPTVLENIRLLAKQPRDYKLVVMGVTTERNVRQAPEVARFCKDAGVDVLRFEPLVPGEYDDDLPMRETAENLAALDEAALIMHDGKTHVDRVHQRAHTATTQAHRKQLVAENMSTCKAPWTQTVIELSGNVVPCCFLGACVTLGNVFETPWDDIWNGERYRAFRASVRAGENPHCLEHCRNWG